jgi:hypothetical protein
VAGLPAGPKVVAERSWPEQLVAGWARGEVGRLLGGSVLPANGGGRGGEMVQSGWQSRLVAHGGRKRFRLGSGEEGKGRGAEV